MQKVLAYLNKYALVFNLISIVFWLYIIYANYQQIQLDNSFDERKNFFIIPIVFIVLSLFNIYLAEKRKKKN